MDKYKEALDNICFYCGHANCDEYLNPKVFEELNIIQELVEKATPKKPIRFIDKFYVSPYKCPVCKTIPHTCNQKYCDECGQALDWSKK